MNTTFYKPVMRALKAAGCILVRRSNGHEIFKSPSGRTITVPRKLDDKDVVHEIYRRAGLKELVP